MPTIDQLAPAVAAADTDELMISQNGVSRKITRAQLIAGLQPQIAAGSGTLLGNPSNDIGGPAPITVGANLTLAGGTLSASATPFVVGALPAGTVPTTSDVVPVGQNGANASVSYAQFMSGLSNVANLDASKMLVKPTASQATLKLADFAASTALTSGAAMTGPLSLAADPAQPLQAATKQYVDAAAAGSLAKTGGTLTGPLTLPFNPTQPLQAATKLYVDGQASAMLPKSGGALNGALTLPADPAQPLQAATKQYVDGRVQRAGDSMTGALTLSSDPAQPFHAATKQYVDARVQRTGDAMTGALTLPSDPAQPLHAATKQYVDGRVQRGGDAMTGALTLSADPAQPLHAATKQYVDAQAGTRLSAAGGAMTGALTLAADPTQLLHAATKQYVDAQAGSRLSTAGGTLTGTLTVSGAGQNTVQNGSLYVGNSDFQHTVLSTSGPQTALFNKVGSATTDTSVTQSYYLVNHSGGTGHVINNLFVGTSVSSTPADGIWGFLSNLTSSSGGGNGGATGHVAGYLQTVRSAVPIPNSTITATATGTTMRIADVTNCFTGYTAGVGYPLSTMHPLPVLINGNPYSVIACTPDTAGATSGPGTLTLSTSIAPADGVAGKSVIGVVKGANLWGGVIEYHEQVDLPSSQSGFGQTLELDWVGNNVDDADTRCFISAVVGKNAATGTDVEIGNVIGVWPGNGSTGTTGASIKRGMQVNVTFSQAIIDGRNATQRVGANAIWLADRQTVSFSSDGKWAVRYNPTRPGLEFLFNNGVLGWIDLQSRYNAPGGFASSGGYTCTATVQSGQAAFDARGAVQNAGGNAVWLADGQRIALSADGTRTLAYDNTSGAIVVSGPVRFSAAPVLPSFTVATLPASPVAGAKAYASNGRKVGEAAGSGTGVELFADSSGR
ncbi:MAG: hypothetical protein J0H14_24440 [Alphaproteobacteria bacterium]|nr:hypothetical protein [Alphaproteobacteria bacterium]